MVTPELLVQMTGCRKSVAEDFAPHIDFTCNKYGIAGDRCVAAFVAQMAHESGNFTQLEENLTYTTEARLIAVWPSRFRMPIAGERTEEIFFDGKRNPRFYVRNPQRLAEFVYGGRLGNKPEGSGDGYGYRGRGLKQLTGRRNYALYDEEAKIGALQSPWLLINPQYAADSAGWYWNLIHGNAMVGDMDDFDRLTVAINGGMNGALERRRLFERALTAIA